MKLHFHSNEYPERTVASAFLAIAILGGAASVRAAEFQTSNGVTNDVGGSSAHLGVPGVSLSGNSFLYGAPGVDWAGLGNNLGMAYLFRNVDTASGVNTESVRLAPSDIASLAAANSSAFSYSVALSGDYGLVGAYQDRRGVPGGSVRGGAYFYKNLDTATGTITESVKLVAAGDASYQLGQTLALSGDTAIVGATGNASPAFSTGRGVAFVYRNLAGASGTVTEQARLFLSEDASPNNLSGFSSGISLGGNMAIVGASVMDSGANIQQGAAYLYRNIDTVTGSVFENAKLIQSDAGLPGGGGDQFGSVSSIGADGTALISAIGGGTTNGGAVYLYRNLGSASGVITENARLIASDAAAGDAFGAGVSHSGNNAIVGARGDDDLGSGSGSAYLFTNVGAATGAVTENVKIMASDGAASDQFGATVSIDGDQFVVMARLGDGAAANSGKAYSGTVSSLTTFDQGNATGLVDGISFTSRQNWVIGRGTDNNTVVLGVGDTGNVTTTGTSVEIGELSGANGNQLLIAGNLEATQVNIGIEQIGGNSGNSLRLENTATFDIGEIRLTPGLSLDLGPAGHNFLIIEQQVDEINALLAYLGSTDFLGTVDGGATFQQITTGNYTDLIRWDYSVTNAGATTIWLIPEPSTAALGFIGAGLLVGRRRRGVTSNRG